MVENKGHNRFCELFFVQVARLRKIPYEVSLICLIN